MKVRPELPTVGELIKQLSGYPTNTLVDFSGWDFYRVKQRGDLLVQIEFNQVVSQMPYGLVEVQNVE